jgi:hypothetical protein
MWAGLDILPAPEFWTSFYVQFARRKPERTSEPEKAVRPRASAFSLRSEPEVKKIPGEMVYRVIRSCPDALGNVSSGGARGETCRI